MYIHTHTPPPTQSPWQLSASQGFLEAQQVDLTMLRQLSTVKETG